MSSDGWLPDGVTHAMVDAAAPAIDEEVEPEPPEWLDDGPAWGEGEVMAEQNESRRRTPSAVVIRRDALVAQVERDIDSLLESLGLPHELVGVAVWEAVAQAVAQVDVTSAVRAAVLARFPEGGAR